MSAPVIQSVSPAAGEVDVVLGIQLEILFDQAVDPASLSTQTFSLMGPGQTNVVDADELIHKSSKPQSGREYITGNFIFPEPDVNATWVQNQKLIFAPDRSLRPGVTYTVLITGKNSLLAKAYVSNPDGEGMVRSLQYSFTTGQLDLPQPPLESPVAAVSEWERPALKPTDILVRPRKAVGNDLTQDIELVFPGPIDPNSFNPEDLIVAGEPFLNDPETNIPPTTVAVTVIGNRMTISVSWGSLNVPPPVSEYSDPGESGPAVDASDFGWMEPENNPFIRPT